MLPQLNQWYIRLLTNQLYYYFHNNTILQFFSNQDLHDYEVLNEYLKISFLKFLRDSFNNIFNASQLQYM